MHLNVNACRCMHAHVQHASMHVGYMHTYMPGYLLANMHQTHTYMMRGKPHDAQVSLPVPGRRSPRRELNLRMSFISVQHARTRTNDVVET